MAFLKLKKYTELLRNTLFLLDCRVALRAPRNDGTWSVTKFYSFVWLVIVLSLAAYNALMFFTPGKIQFDLLALLPESQNHKMVAAKQFMTDANLAGRIVILFGDENRTTAKQSLNKFRQKIQGQPIQELSAKTMMQDYKRLFTDLYPYRAGLLSKQDQQLPDAQLAKRAIASILSPFGAPQPSDPFGLYPQFVKSLHSINSLQRDGDDFYVNDSGKTWYVFQAIITQPIYSLRLQEEMIGKLNIVFAELPVEILRTGAIFYAAAGTQQAQAEISEIGVLSILGIILILLLVFRTTRPLLLAVAVVTSGLMVGLAACFWLFGMVHILALVFGCSLVGVAVDYALHYFCASYKKDIERHAILGTLMPALALGVLSSAVGYGLLIVAPFPGIQQMAVLACVGLLCTFISVCLWGPYFVKPLKIPAIGERIQATLEKLASLGHKKHFRLVLSLLLLTLFVAGSFVLSFDDNVRSFQSLDADLDTQEKRIKSMMKIDNSSKFLQVTGNSLEEVLQKEEQLMAKLDAQKVSYKALAELLPSQQRQQQNRAKVARLYQNHGAQIKDILGIKKLGEPETALLSEIKNLPTGWKELVSYSDNGLVTGRIILHSPVNEIGEAYIDPVLEYSNLFAAYREVMMALVLSVLLGIAVLLAIRQNVRAASMIMAPVLLSILTTVGVISLLGMSFTLFHAMGLMLVLCIGIDYALFLYWREPNQGGLLLLGNCLAAVTTILSFGLLALSKTAAVHSFGLAVFIGIVLCFFITTLFLGQYRGQHDHRK